jgi:hypothetical protein
VGQALNPIEYLTIPEIREQILPLDRHTLQKLFINQPGVLVVGRRETIDPRKVADGQPWRKHRRLLVPRTIVERVKREMLMTSGKEKNLKC